MKNDTIFFIAGKAALLVVICVGAMSCEPSRGTVVKQWSLAMRELNIVPVFPPREDVQVGDLYVSPVSPADEERVLAENNFVPIGLWVGAVDLETSLADFYDKRLSFPKTTTAPTTNPSDIYAQPTTQSNIYQPGHDVGRLRLVGFPMFMSATFQQGDLSAVIPAEAVSLAVGAGFTGSHTVTVSVPVAESYGLPAPVVYNKLVLPSGQFDVTHVSGKLTVKDLTHYLSSKNMAATPRGAPAEATTEHGASREATTQPCDTVIGYLRLITEVYYARAIDVSIGSTSAAGATVAGHPAASIPTTLSALAPATQPSAPDPINYTTATPQQIAADLNRQLSTSGGQTVPGGSVKFLSVSQSGLSMRRTYERPVAIGYRGVSLTVVLTSSGTYEIAAVGAENGPISSVVPTSLIGGKKFVPTTK